MHQVKAISGNGKATFEREVAEYLASGYEIHSSGMTSSITSGSTYSSLTHTWYAVLVKKTPAPLNYVDNLDA